MRGDHQMNETKLTSALGGKTTRPMTEDEIKQLFKSPAGFLGPIGVVWAKDMKDAERPLLLVDKALEGRTNLIGGANKEDYHLRNLTPGRDFQPTAYVDLRSVTAGEACPKCGASVAHRHRGGDWPHLQAGLQVHGVHGRTGAGQEWQGSHADHGQLWHWNRAHSDRLGGAEQRRKWLLAAAADCAV